MPEPYIFNKRETSHISKPTLPDIGAAGFHDSQLNDQRPFSL